MLGQIQILWSRRRVWGLERFVRYHVIVGAGVAFPVCFSSGRLGEWQATPVKGGLTR